MPSRLDKIRQRLGEAVNTETVVRVDANDRIIWSPEWIVFLGTAPEDVRLLLDAVEAAIAYEQWHNSDELDQDPSTERLRAALAPLLKDENAGASELRGNDPH